jgi:predicted nucleic acid-binding protein
MRVMVDSNVIISAVYNPSSKPAAAVRGVCENHELVLCEHIIAECHDVVGRKFPQHAPMLVRLFATLGYTLAAAPQGGAVLPVPKDAPILNAAIAGDVDIIISGDAHFLNLELQRPKVMTPAQYIEMYEA